MRCCCNAVEMTEAYRDGLYTALPDGVREPLPWVLACHGSGRCALSYRDIPFYARQRDIALAAGCAFAACDLGQDTYGTPLGLDRLTAFFDRIVRTLPVRPQAALWASSAGGVVMFRFAQTHPERVALLLGTFPIWSLSSVTHLKSMRAAWGGYEGDALLRAIAPYDPARFPEKMPDIPIRVAHGLCDEIVPPGPNALALKAALGRRVSLYLTQDKHSTDAFGLYETPLFMEALRAMAAQP